MIPRIRSIKPLKNYTLQVTFDDNREIIYDVKEDIDTIEEFKDLESIPGFFEQVQLDESRTCVFWSDRIDLPSDAIYEYGKIMYSMPSPDEVVAIEETKADKGETVPHNAINWE